MKKNSSALFIQFVHEHVAIMITIRGIISSLFLGLDRQRNIQAKNDLKKILLTNN